APGRPPAGPAKPAPAKPPPAPQRPARPPLTFASCAFLKEMTGRRQDPAPRRCRGTEAQYAAGSGLSVGLANAFLIAGVIAMLRLVPLGGIGDWNHLAYSFGKSALV